MSKAERLINEWGMEEVGEQLESYWLGTGQEQYSLRKLADWFNEQLLKCVLEANGETYVEGEVENMYRLLTEDDVSSGVQTEVEMQLQQTGVNVGGLKESFVSHQSIYTYLTKIRGVSLNEETTDESKIKKTNTTIQRLMNRTDAVVTQNLESLRNTDRISLGEFSLFVDVNVLCHDCDTQFGIQELLSQRGCDCE